MDVNRETVLMEVIRGFFYRIVEDNGLEFHPSDMEKVKDDKWLQSVFEFKGRDVNGTLNALFTRNTARKQFDIHSKKYNVKLDKKYSKAVKPVGKDSEGFKVLFIDLTDLLNLSNDKEIHEHISYWMERLERQGNDKITIVLHHGKDKFMERTLNVLMLLQNMFLMYPGFLASIIIFKDFTSKKCKVCLNVFFGDTCVLVGESDWSRHFNLDEKYDLSDGYLKLAEKKPYTVENNGNKCEESITAPVEVKQQCTEETKKPESEILDNVGDKEKEQRNKIKHILTKLHDIENQVFQLITEVQELI